MAQLTNRVSVLCAASSIVFAFGCAVDPGDQPESAVAQASQGGSEIHPEDDCDPATFGALCKAGFPGLTTLSAFLAEFNATNQVAKWEYGGGQAQVSLGNSFQVNNRGGETHTFSVVANFGGGRVPFLNAGNATVAPECVAGPNATNVDIAAGGGLRVTTGATGVMKTKGTFKVQCCIHPWMRTTVVIQ
jgi:hypothetical protein